jgi:hypothetical protein
VVLVGAERGCGAPLVEDQGAVEEFTAEAADDAFGDRVGSRFEVRSPLDQPPVLGLGPVGRQCCHGILVGVVGSNGWPTRHCSPLVWARS